MKVKKLGNDYLIAVEIGEELITSLLNFASSETLSSGYLSGIGALRDFELGYYWLDRKEYKRQKYSEIVELIACTGNLALRQDAPFIHLHVALGREDYSMIGGHLFSGIVAVTAELFFRPLQEPVMRAWNERTGLFLLDLPAYKAV